MSCVFDMLASRPLVVHADDWEVFVEQSLFPDGESKTTKGIAARQQLLTPQYTGRKSCARKMHEMKANEPDRTFTRAKYYLACHTSSSGSYPTQQIDDDLGAMREILRQDPSSGGADLDHDPVSQVYGRDHPGRVRGMGRGITSTQMEAAQPATHLYHRQQGEIYGLQQTIYRMQEELAELRSYRTPSRSQSHQVTPGTMGSCAGGSSQPSPVFDSHAVPTSHPVDVLDYQEIPVGCGSDQMCDHGPRGFRFYRGGSRISG